MEKKVYQVTEVTLTILKRKPLTLQINVKGETNTGGWSNPRLDPFIYIVPPPDGIYEFNFLAEAPTGPVTTAITPIETEYWWESFPDELKGVKIYAETNNKVEKL
jgi:hypothetical protein